MYEGYLENPKNPEIKERALAIAARYCTATHILNTIIQKAVNPLVNIGINLEPSPSKEEIKKIIEELKNLQLS